MLKREITYENANDETVTETFYFNLTMAELLELEVQHEGGLQGSLVRMIENKDQKKLLEEFKSWILSSYGVKSEDGRRFIKNDQLRDEFSQSFAYDALFTEFTLNEQALATFINGIMPKKLEKIIADLEAKGKLPQQVVTTNQLPAPKE